MLGLSHDPWAGWIGWSMVGLDGHGGINMSLIYGHRSSDKFGETFAFSLYQLLDKKMCLDFFITFRF